MTIYKIGYTASKWTHDAAAEDALAQIRAAGDQDKVVSGPDFIESEAHQAAGTFLVVYETGKSEEIARAATNRFRPVRP